MEKNRSSLIDLAYTLSVRREHLPHRAFCVTHGGLPLEVSAPSKASSTTPEIVFVCTGQGAQWAQMGAKLMEEFPAFEEDIRAMDRALAKLPYPPSWTIEGT
jgi:acyl transferase domain-containing protein